MSTNDYRDSHHADYDDADADRQLAHIERERTVAFLLREQANHDPASDRPF